MHVKIGAYEINTSEVFTSIDEAVKHVLDRHPNLEVDLVKSKVKPFIKSDANQSGDISKEDRPGDTGRAKADNGSSGRKPIGKA
ncbi:hypothetical protein CMU21_15850 [Elizabethkingia anophelis]|nr:hypothetical protein [Elizabethkingia anophelis]